MNGIVVVVSADTEWRVMQEILPDVGLRARSMILL
jgi:hypothetical protein